MVRLAAPERVIFFDKTGFINNTCYLVSSLQVKPEQNQVSSGIGKTTNAVNAAYALWAVQHK